MDADLEHAAGKLQGVLADTSLAASWHRGETREAGRGAGPGREPAATWDHDGGVRLLRLQASRVANPSLALASGYGELVRRFDDLPRGGLGGEAFIDPGGVAGGTTFARSGERDTAEWNLGASAYFSLGATRHELELGADAVLRRELDLGVGRGGAAADVATPRIWRLGVRLGWR